MGSIARAAWLLCAGLALGQGLAQETTRQAQVARRGQDVMPFSLAATVHVFTKTAEGGVQEVDARRPGDAAQVALIRAHLHALQEEFSRRDFSAPERIHGADMPGLAELRRAAPQTLAVTYREVPAGAQLRYRTDDAQVRAALHAWFDAQLADHGADAMAGHAAMHGHGAAEGPP